MANLKQAYERKYHYVYKTTNILNNMYYLGLHSSDRLKNNYLGSGSRLKKAIKFYGKENFNKIILKTFSTREEASNYEKELVTEKIINDANSYNLCGGGDNGGIGVTRSEESKEKNRQAHLGRTHGEETKKLCRQVMLVEHQKRQTSGNDTYKKIKATRNTETSKAKTSAQALAQWSDPEFKKRMISLFKEKGNSVDFKNKSSYNAHRRFHVMGTKVNQECRWCQGEVPNWDISHLDNSKTKITENNKEK